MIDGCRCFLYSVGQTFQSAFIYIYRKQTGKSALQLTRDKRPQTAILSALLRIIRASLSAMLVVDEKNRGVEFDVLAKPKSSQNKIMGVHDGALKISITAPPEKGKANAGILKKLSGALGIAVSSMSIIRGETGRRKRIRIEGLTAEAVRDRIDEYLKEAGA